MDTKEQELIVNIVAATVSQLIKEQVIPSRKDEHRHGRSDPRAEVKQGRQVYGLRGIQDLFHVSHKTAQKYKDGILKPAVRQNGRKIITDADYAMELFSKASDADKQ